jgi:hypothetical protein
MRACPVCPQCGSKKFKVVENSDKVVVECLSCAKRIRI